MLAYLVDADHGRAFWVSADARLDDWTASTLDVGARQHRDSLTSELEATRIERPSRG